MFSLTRCRWRNYGTKFCAIYFKGDMRLMHPGVPGNPRLQYAPIPSPPVIQGCPRPYRPPSYPSNMSGAGTSNFFDGRNQKIRKQR